MSNANETALQRFYRQQAYNKQKDICFSLNGETVNGNDLRALDLKVTSLDNHTNFGEKLNEIDNTHTLALWLEHASTDVLYAYANQQMEHLYDVLKIETPSVPHTYEEAIPFLFAHQLEQLGKTSQHTICTKVKEHALHNMVEDMRITFTDDAHQALFENVKDLHAFVSKNPDNQTRNKSRRGNTAGHFAYALLTEGDALDQIIDNYLANLTKHTIIIEKRTNKERILDKEDIGAIIGVIMVHLIARLQNKNNSVRTVYDAYAKLGGNQHETCQPIILRASQTSRNHD